MSKVVSEERSERAEAAFRLIEDSIGPGPWLCGPDMTVADLCCVSLVAAIEVRKSCFGRCHCAWCAGNTAVGRLAALILSPSFD